MMKIIAGLAGVALFAGATLDQIIADIKSAKPAASERSERVEAEPND